MGYEQADIEALVREVVARTLGSSQRWEASSGNKRPILDEAAVRQMPAASVQRVSAGTLVTPLARQVALERRIKLEMARGDQLAVGSEQSLAQNPGRLNMANPSPKAEAKTVALAKTIALGADHGGYQLKETIKQALQTADAGYTLIDCGTHSADSVDYPDFAYAVACLVAGGRAWRGIIIDGAGIGSCMAANKVPGVLAAMCYDQATAVNSREHNNANVLTLGAGLIGPHLAQQIVHTWLTTEFGGGRHARRVNKIEQIGKRFSK